MWAGLHEFDNPELRMLVKVSSLRMVEILGTDVRSQALAAGSRLNPNQTTALAASVA